MKKILKGVAIAVIAVIVCFLSYINFGYHKKFNDTPYPDVKASTDPSVIARGKYLVYGPAHCAMCHINMGEDDLADAGKEVSLAGGFELNIPIGIFRPANLTSDKETGIGAMSDKEIARMLRYNIKRNGEATIPFMPFQELSEEDMIAVISFLRTIPPVRHEVKPSEYNFIGKIVKTFALKPSMPKNEPPKSVPRDTSAAYGKYLAMSVANCYGCHTNRNMKTGEFTGKPFSGGLQFAQEPELKGFGFITPNLTPDKETGRIAEWEQVAFLDRMHKGRLQKGSPMPWGPFSRMDESDLKAIYNYLHSVEPVKNEIAKTVFQPGEKMPELKD